MGACEDMVYPLCVDERGFGVVSCAMNRNIVFLLGRIIVSIDLVFRMHYMLVSTTYLAAPVNTMA